TEGDVSALTRKNIADGRTNSTRSTGNERAFSLKQKAHLAMFLLKLRTGASLYDGRLKRESRRPVNSSEQGGERMLDEIGANFAVVETLTQAANGVFGVRKDGSVPILDD